MNTHELLKRIKTRYIQLVEKTIKNETCAICDELKPVVVLPNCCHFFCSSCLEKHAENNSTCPICREEVTNYLDPSTSKIVTLNQTAVSNDDNVNIIHLSEYGEAHITSHGQLYHTYLTVDSPFQRVRKQIQFLVVGFALGMAYMLYNKKNN